METTDNYDIILKTILLDDWYVEKSNILNHYHQNKYSKSTVGVEFGFKIFNKEGNNVKANIWDTSAQERFQAIGLLKEITENL